jgi:hypothetical protein
MKGRSALACLSVAVWAMGFVIVKPRPVVCVASWKD